MEKRHKKEQPGAKDRRHTEEQPGAKQWWRKAYKGGTKKEAALAI